jgi:hypothetical protein
LSSLSLSPEHDAALKKYEDLRGAIPAYEQEKEDLLYILKPKLESVYYERVGKLKVELLHVQTLTYALRRKMELIQAFVNQGKQVQMQAIEVLLKKEMEERVHKLDYETRRMEAMLALKLLPLLKPEDSAMIRSVYYKLAKNLHPDLNPDPEGKNRSLWEQVSEAYRMGDLQRMQMLELLADAGGDHLPEAPKILNDLKERIRMMNGYMEKLMEDIRSIKSAFPFDLADLLPDQEWVSGENKKSIEAIAASKAQQNAFREAIDKLVSGGAS